ncbi:mandelate racemase/muconate lactonizing enzyme family protein [Pseudonocardia acidicola]|uniref:Mandelate racemase/muconate lactonizing enzyme family protein n=1 Tax=Pseudonocardia acidicola TaxID=2724939 RepID=A0ABX1SMY4_9PSEU|nr:mandelate racemase/muconate lactonizing enzyme family protein [Pseudonocardia acidicola]NMI01777.1 mandelate racemase/muconate lactonizing enzyme family protein [Pseudonocardia acidicola]
MRIVGVQAFPTSFPTSERGGVRLGIGKAVKRDAVVVKVTTEDGLVGWGEAHHGRSPGTVAHLINSTLAPLVVGADATDTVGVWQRIYTVQLSSHGLGAAASIGLSGIDMALWDLRGKAIGWPVHQLLGGASRPVPAYAGGVSLGFAEPAALVEMVAGLRAEGYRAVKLRIGEGPVPDLERIAAVRRAFPELTILTDANTAYGLDDVRAVAPGLREHRVGWLEEPFPPHDHRRYATAASFLGVPLAAGENHYTRFEFHRVIEDGAISVLQPDLSKAGGITEVARIAALASAWKLPVHPHTSATGLNTAATIHLLAAVDNGGYFEADVSPDNLFREQLTSEAFRVNPADGTVRPLDKPGLGVEVDEDFLAAHPVIEGPGFVP